MTILLLGGTSEARDIAKALAARGVKAVVSLAGATTAPRPYAIPTRSGGFGGQDKFKDYLQDIDCTAIINATHPFTAQMTARAYRVATMLGIPYLRVLRPAWPAQDGWINVDTVEEAIQAIPATARLFLAVGGRGLAPYAALRADLVLIRRVDPAAEASDIPNAKTIIARPPFTVEAETALLQEHQITHLIAKNAGGVTQAKLAAAAAIGVKVVMIRRPAHQGGDVAETVEETMRWGAIL